MTGASNHVVITTIHIPEVLLALVDNLTRHGHLRETMCWVIGDRKTPTGCGALCQRVAAMGLETRYLDLAAQEAWGARFPAFYARLPLDNDSRRMIGVALALEHDCRRVILLDDDNFPTGDDFIAGHKATGSLWRGPLQVEPAGFHNVCESLEITPHRALFPRGYPFRLREGENSGHQAPADPGAVIGVTQGLWLGAPDIDAVTWLNGPVTAVDFHGDDLAVLARETWMPINTQNTSVVRELIPGFLCLPMGFAAPGGRLERYGDIWGGYFLQALLRDTPYHVAYGRPLVDHRRHVHDPMADLRREYWGMLLTDWLLERLRQGFRPDAATIPDRVRELAAFLVASSVTMPSWSPPELRHVLQETSATLEAWAELCREWA